MISHVNGVHDEFCRCRDCKPPLVGQQTAAKMRVEVAVIVLIALAVVLAFVWCWA